MDHYKKEKENEEKITENIYYNQNSIFNTKLLTNSNENNQTNTTAASKTKVLDSNFRASPVRNLYKNLIKKNSSNLTQNQNELANKSTINKNLNNNNIINTNDNNINNYNVRKESDNLNNIKGEIPSSYSTKQESDCIIKKQSNAFIFSGLKLLKEIKNIKNNSDNNNINNKNYNNQNSSTTGDRTIYANIDAKYDEMFRKIEADYDPKKLEYEKRIENIDINLMQLDNDIKLLKSNLDILFAKQREYYKELLSEGIDVRSEGLAWIVKRLIELNEVIDHAIFPRFLHREHIEYIVFLSFKSVEIAQIKILMKMLRLKQNKESKYKKIQNGINHTSLATKFNELKFDEFGHKNNNKEKNNLKLLDDKNKIDLHKVKFELDSKNRKEQDEVEIIIENDAEKVKDQEAQLNKNLKNNRNLNVPTETNENSIQNQRKSSCKMFFNSSYTGENSEFYIKSFSEKALNTFDRIFQKYEIIGKNRINHFLQDKIVKKNFVNNFKI